MSILVTGSAGFIGSALVRHLLERWPDERIVSLDALTYSGHVENLEAVLDHPRHAFVRGDITDGELVTDVFNRHDVRSVIHLAAESHVDRSIAEPARFVMTNVVGTATLLAAAVAAWGDATDRRFLHVSTDEVFGELGPTGAFSEATPYAPNSPYSASKAGSDHLVRAWHETYGLSTVITNCTNNYGPRQFPEKLIPVVIGRALSGDPVPVYGDGSNVRDWLYVEDHCDGLATVFESGADGETYCLGGEAEVSNLELAGMVLDLVDEVTGRPSGTGRDLIAFVTDRPGHDFRYAMDITKARRELGWEPSHGLADGLRRTIEWYVANEDWVRAVTDSDEHRDFAGAWYGERA